MVVKPASRLLAMCGSATLTTVPSRNATPEPSTVASRTPRPTRLPYVTSPTPDSTADSDGILPGRAGARDGQPSSLGPNACDNPLSAAVSSVGTTHTFDDSDAAICGSVWRYW